MDTKNISSANPGKLSSAPVENGNLLVKRSYLQELAPLSQSYKLGDSGPEVVKIKEWLMLWQFNEDYVTNVIDLRNGGSFDEVFDSNTEQVAITIQTFLDLNPTGIVDAETWRGLVSPMRNAFSLYPYKKATLNEKLIYFASKHLQYHACELDTDNLGPWVRAYMNGDDGAQWYWCQGFACTVLDQAFSSVGQLFTDYYPNVVSCEDFREYARSHALLVTHDDLVAKTYVPRAGDLVLYISSADSEAHHTEIVYEVLDPEDGDMRTIGGNTNFSGSSNGVGVFLVDRNFLESYVEIVRLEGHLISPAR